MRYALNRSLRARRLTVTVRHDGSVTVTAPRWATSRAIERFIAESAAWIEKTVARARRYASHTFLPRGRARYLALKEPARDLVRRLATRHAAGLGVRFSRIAIKDLRHNWGSCSELGNLNFNYKLLLLPERLAEYVVVHELCHLLHFDHSKAFWARLSTVIPDHKERVRELRRFHP